MAGPPVNGPSFGLPVGELRSNETVLRHWPAPKGRLLLTNQRCLILSHPHPLHRNLEWEVDLESVTSLEVVAAPSVADPAFAVMVNEVAIYTGEPNVCAEIQSSIDNARTDRSIAVYGRLVPYSPPPTPDAD